MMTGARRSSAVLAPDHGLSNLLFVDAEAVAAGGIAHAEFPQVRDALGHLLVLRRRSGVGKIDNQRQRSGGSNSLRSGPHK